MSKVSYAINRGSKKNLMSPCGLKTLEENEHVRGFLVNPEAEGEDVLLEWRIKDYTLYLPEFSAALKKAAEIVGHEGEDDQTVVRRTFRDWIGHPPAMTFEFGDAGEIYMTCICKLSPQTPILRKDLGAWLKFAQLFGQTRWDTFQTPDFEAFWVDDSGPIPGEYIEGSVAGEPYRFRVPLPGQSFLVEWQKATAITKEQWRNRNFTGCVWFDTDGTPHLRQEEVNTHTFVYVQFER